MSCVITDDESRLLTPVEQFRFYCRLKKLFQKFLNLNQPLKTPLFWFTAGEPGERGESGPQTGGQHDPSGRQPAPDQGGDCEPESGP